MSSPTDTVAGSAGAGPTRGPMPQIARYQAWLERTRALRFDDYEAMWRWSVDDLEGFWGSVFEYFAIESPTPHRCVVTEPVMPGARWFPGAQVNYARQALRHADVAHAAGRPAIVFRSESGAAGELGWPQLRAQVAALAQALKALGVTPGDRVCAYLPNIPQTVVAFLATASVGAIWSVCSPDMGPVSVLDRFRQIAPKVLIACDGYRYG
ncbi:MAG: AMP-binding protein, partial [Burkholderiales bacterium]